MTTTLRVDKEFLALCPPLSNEEAGLLESSIESEGCREPIIVWASDGETILDGHNRYRICSKLGTDFKTRQHKITTRDDAINWIIANQLMRRNLTEDQKCYLRGKRYNAEKKATPGQPQKECGQNDPISSGRTSERLAQEYDIAEATIRRDAKYAEAVDKIAASSGKKARDSILSGDAKLTKTDTIKLAELPKETQKEAMEGGLEAVKKAIEKSKPKKSRKPKAERPSALERRAARAALRKLEDILTRIGVAGQCTKHLNAIRSEIEDA